jgi:hypothetical protein
MTMKATQNPEASMVRVELSYCPRCGTLRAHSEGADDEVCAACVRFLAWVRTGCARPMRRRPRRPEKTEGGQT